MEVSEFWPENDRCIFLSFAKLYTFVPFRPPKGTSTPSMWSIYKATWVIYVEVLEFCPGNKKNSKNVFFSIVVKLWHFPDLNHQKAHLDVWCDVHTQIVEAYSYKFLIYAVEKKK